MIVEKSHIYLRGQIWYWWDPIYQSKENGFSVADGEATMRYSRYVLVMQDMQSVDNQFSVLVIPCSSSKKLSTDLPVNIVTMNHSGISWVKPSAIFPVSSKSLRQYICTVPEETMVMIDAVVLQLIMPTAIPKFTKVHQKYLKSVMDELEEGLDAMKVEPSELSMGCIPAAISKISNTMKYTLQEHNLYQLVQNFFVSKNDVPHFSDEFYSQVANSIYYSLLEYLDIHKTTTGRFKFPGTDALKAKIGMIQVLERLYGDNRIKYDKPGYEVMDKFREDYPDMKSGFDKEWATYLKNKLMVKLNLIERGVELIMEPLIDVYCER